jgi:hypothetical protein
VKSALLSLLTAAALLCTVIPAALGQTERPTLKPYTLVIPAKNFSWAAARTAEATPAAGAPTGLRIWTTTVNSTKDGNAYPIAMVGQSPFSSTTTTNIPTVIIPVVININGTVFNPTQADPICMVAPNNVPLTVFRQSPLFNNAAFTMNGVNVGSTQYIDAFQRANFWTVIAPTYHTRLGTITIPAVQTYNVPLGSGAVYSDSLFGNGGCGPHHNPNGFFGVMDINAFDPWVTGTALPTAHITPDQFPILLLYNVVMSIGPPTIANCCVLGYHGATAGPPSGKTYSPMEFDTSGIFGSGVSDTSISAHEIGEWMDDPYGNNPTPNWGNIGQVSGCQGNLEVGDPLTGTNFPAVTMRSNHYTYHLQELAFFSWFYNSQPTPSIGAGGKFSNNRTFGGPSKACPPGGTN